MSVPDGKYITKKQKFVLVATATSVVAVTVIARRKINARVTAAAANAVQEWIDELDAKNFNVFIVAKQNAVVFDKAMQELAQRVAA